MSGIYEWVMKSHEDRNYVDLYGMEADGRRLTDLEYNAGFEASPRTKDFLYLCGLTHQMMNASFITSEWGNFGHYRATELRKTDAEGNPEHPYLVKVAEDWEDFNNCARFGFNLGQKTGRALTQALVALGDRISIFLPIASPLVDIAALVARIVVSPLLMVGGAFLSMSIGIGLVALRFTITLALELTLILPLIRFCLSKFDIKIPGLIMYMPAIKTSQFIGKLIAGALATIPTAVVAACETVYLGLIGLANLKRNTTPDDYSKLTAPLDQLISDIQMEINKADKDSDKHAALCKLQGQVSYYKRELEPRTNFISYLRDLVPISQDYEIDLDGEKFRGIMGACSETQNAFKHSYNWITGLFGADAYFTPRSMATDPIAINIASKLVSVTRDDASVINTILHPPEPSVSSKVEGTAPGCLERLRSLVAFKRIVVLEASTLTVPGFSVGMDGAASVASTDAGSASYEGGGIPPEVRRMRPAAAYARGCTDANGRDPESTPGSLPTDPVLAYRLGKFGADAIDTRDGDGLPSAPMGAGSVATGAAAGPTGE